MALGNIAQNRNINAAISGCFERIAPTDVPKFVRKFHSNAGNSDQCLHIFRELLVGGYLAEFGRRVSYEMIHDGDRPDWTLLDADGEVEGIAELTNFHTERLIENEIKTTLRPGEVYCDWVPDPTRRLYQSIQRKVDRYDSLIGKLKCPYVVGLYLEFLAAIEADEVYEVLNVAYDGGIFSYSDRISGVLAFEEDAGQYKFTYFPSDSARYRIDIPNGMFHPASHGST